MEAAVIALAIACAVLALVAAAFAACVPLLVWRMLAVERRQDEQAKAIDAKVDKVDEVVEEVLKAAGMGK